MAELAPSLKDEKGKKWARECWEQSGGDHDVGKNVVKILLEARFEEIDLGVDAPPEKFIEKVKGE